MDPSLLSVPHHARDLWAARKTRYITALLFARGGSRGRLVCGTSPLRE
jgi:hypothetical protein